MLLLFRFLLITLKLYFGFGKDMPLWIWKWRTQGNYATVGSAIVAIAIVGRGGWMSRPLSTVAIWSWSTLWQMIWSSTMLENVSSVTLYHKEGHVVDGTIRNVVYAFIWFSFATVYERLPHPPLPTIWQLPLMQLPLFPSVAQFPCVGLTHSLNTIFRRKCDSFMYQSIQFLIKYWTTIPGSRWYYCSEIRAMRSRYSKPSNLQPIITTLRIRKVNHYTNSPNWSHVAYKPTDNSQTYTLQKQNSA